MVNDIAVQDFVNAIKEQPTDNNTVYNATVSHIDDEGVVWVNIHGSNKDTPTASTSSEVKRGDIVTVNWRNNKLYIAGNYSDPSAGMFRVANVEANALNAFNTAEDAWQFASDASALANGAMVSANGKNSIYYTAIAPTGGTYKVGDTWFNSSEDNAIYTWDGAAWTKEELGEDAIANLSITNAKIADATIQNGKIANLDAAKITTGSIAADRMKVNSISAINSNTGTVKIAASKVEIDGTATFNAIKSSADATYDAIGAASTAVDSLQIGGRNLLQNSMMRASYTADGITITQRESAKQWVDISGTATALVDQWVANLQSLTVTNATVTISANSVFSDSVNNYFYVSTSKDGAWYKDYKQITWYSSTERRLTINLENGETLRYIRLHLANGTTISGGYRFKVELGNKQTDWSPAPEDVQAEIDAKKSVHTLTSSITAGRPYATILGYAAEGTVTTFSVVTATGVKVGDTVRLAFLANDMGTGGTTVYIVGEVTAVNPNSVTLKAHGLDTTVIDGGHILTGTLDASKVNVSNLTVGAFTQEAQNDILNSNSGLNMLLDWDASSLLAVDAKSARYVSGASYTSSQEFFAVTDPPETNIHNGFRITLSTASTSEVQSALVFYGGESNIYLPMSAGNSYTVSCWARCTSGAGRLRIYYRDNGAVTNTGVLEALTSTWKRVYAVVTPTSVDYGRVYFYANFQKNTTGVVEMCGFKCVPNGDSAEATSYITSIGNDGIRVHPSSTQNNSAVINANGLEIFKGGTSVAMYGDTARVGKLSKPHILIKDGGIELWYSSEATLPLANFGYGSAISGTGGTELGSFFSFGGRVADSLVGNFSVAEGFVNTASGYSSHAQGTTNTASGYASYAQGDTNTASGSCAHAEGYYTTASGNNSHASGNHTIAAGAEQTAIGRYNVQDTTSLFIIGKGTMAGRANAFSVGSDGKVYVNGSTVHSSDRRLKQHLNYLDDSADEFIRKLRPAHYIKDDEHHTGFYAQDVAEADKWDCMTGEDSSGYMTLSYMEIIAPLVAYCQHLEKRIEELERG